MAAKNHSSRADRAVSDARKKTSTSSHNTPKKTTASKKAPAVKTEYDKSSVSGNVITALVSICLFILFLVISINPDGALLKVVQAVVLGLIGQAGFYFSIPALLYLFIINVFGRKTAVHMRSICVVIFVLLCGSVYHLLVQTQGMASGFAVVLRCSCVGPAEKP